MNGDFHLRPATNGDCETVRKLVSTILREHGLALDPNNTDADLADLESFYLRCGGSFDVLVNSRGEVVGTIGLSPLVDGRCELRKMYLATSSRGRGLGKRMLRHVLERARQLGFRRMELETAHLLVAACRLYESFGFQPFVPDHMSARCDRAYFLDL